MKILILDDDPSCASAMSQYFSMRGHDLEVASELEQAEALLLNGRFDAILTDIRLTGVHQAEGLLLLALVHELALDTRVLVVTAHDVEEIRREAFRLGAEHFFVKPVPLDRIASVLDASGPRRVH